MDGQITLFDLKPHNPVRQPCNRECEVEWCSLECFLKRGYIRANGQFVRDANGVAKRMSNRECDYTTSLREVHQIPEISDRWRVEEGWTDHWHYVDEEQPKEDGFYWTVSLVKSWYNGVTSEFYNHTYGLYHDGIWLVHNDSTKKWQPWWKDHTLVCWAVMPQCYWTEDFIEKSTHDIDKYRVKKEMRKHGNV